MLQRRQTLYLLTIVVLGIVMCFVPLMEFHTLEGASVQRMYELSFIDLSEVNIGIDWVDPLPICINGLWVLTVTCLLIPVLALIDIFLFKHRIIQARLNIFLAVLCLGFYGILSVYSWFIVMNSGLEWSICFGACIPLVSFILTLGATRLILKDEALVRAADRLR